MKQKKYGKKIINWHRPLGRSQLRRRYLRQRYQDIEYTNSGSLRSTEIEVEVDDCWNPYDPYYGDWYGDWNCADEGDINQHQLDNLLQSVLNRPSLSDSFETVLAASDNQYINDGAPAVDLREFQAGEIEARLHAHVDKARDFMNNPEPLRSELIRSVGHWKNADVIQRVADQYQNDNLARQLCFFAPFWVRNPCDWDESGDTHLPEHLFVLYEVPAFLYSEWFKRDFSGGGSKWLYWFILLGLGGSLKRAAGLFNWDIPAKFTQHLADAPANVSPTEACLYAEVKRLGGSEQDWRRLLQNVAFVIDPTERSDTESYARFWRSTVQWLIKHSGEISDEESHLILSWAMHEYTEAERLRAQAFSWKGRSPRAVIQRSIQYQRDRERPWSLYKWQGHDWEWTLDGANGDSSGEWSFEELTSGEQLFREGEAMHHCVSSYAARCAAGHSAIVSVKCEGVRRLTVEISPRTKHIVQVRGPYNRPADATEQRVVALWKNTVLHGGGVLSE